MHWQRLDRESSVTVINSVQSDANAGMFSIGTSEVQRARLPFYSNYFVYKVTNFASLPSFTFQYLSDGLFFQYIDGTEGPIYAVNDKGELNLSMATLLPYLEFFFSFVGDEDGDVILINNPNDMPLLDSLEPEAYHAVFSQHKPVEVTETANGYTVIADLYKESQLVRAKIDVTHKGRVQILEQKMIMHELLDSGRIESVM